VFRKSWDRLCASRLKGILVVADSHSNKEEQTDASSDLLLERLLAATKAMRTMAMRRWQCPLQRTAGYSRGDFRTSLCRAKFYAAPTKSVGTASNPVLRLIGHNFPKTLMAWLRENGCHVIRKVGWHLTLSQSVSC
jgi:hypothetical protein